MVGKMGGDEQHVLQNSSTKMVHSNDRAKILEAKLNYEKDTD